MRTSPHPPNQQQPVTAAQGEAITANPHEHRHHGARQFRSFA